MPVSVNSLFFVHGVIGKFVIEDDIRTFVQVFSHCDEGNKRYLSRTELKLAIVCLFGYKPSKVSNWSPIYYRVESLICKVDIIHVQFGAVLA
jgi:hypothetical protein